MFQHNILIALRNLQRHKGSFFINLVGLSTGLVCTFLIYLWVGDELKFDKFHVNDNRLFQVMELSKENGKPVVHESTQGLLAQSMAKDLPEVQEAVSVFSLKKEGIYLPLRFNEKAVKGTGLFASANFFAVFSFPLLEGEPQTVLKQKEGIVISESLAKNLFGSTQNARGKTIEWEILGNKKTAMVSGVFAALPANSSMQFDFVLSYDLLITDIVPNFQKWWNEGVLTYVVLKNGADQAKFNAKISNYIQRYFKETIFTLFTRRYSDAYLYGKYENGVQAGGRIEYVKLFSIVAIFILAIACINFMNLSTAKASRRLKEVGIKKTLGSSRKTLILQFMTEAIFMAFLALFFAAALVVVFLPVFNEITGKSLSLHLTPSLVMVALGIGLITGILSGSYPAFYLSGFNPIAVLKGKIKNSTGELIARKGLVVFQFTISLVLIVSVLVIYKQVQYIQSKDLGYDKSNVIYFDREGAVVQNTDAFLAELKNIQGVQNASAIMQGMVQSPGIGASTYGIDWPGKKQNELVDFIVRAVDFDMLETLAIQVKEGRSFSRKFGDEQSGLVFNEAAIRAMGLKDPVGTPIRMWGQDMKIVGVVKDFHISSLHDPIEPMVFMFNPKQTTTIMVKIAAGKEKETISRIEAFFKKINPGYVFEYKFLDEAYQSQYLSEQRVSLLSRYFAALAILISFLGLFGLAAFNAEVRTKEIGIRKVLGASVQQLMLMLSKDFIWLVLIAILISFPLAWWAMNAWLGGFAYRINIGAGVFIIAGISILLITMLTVGYQSIRSAIINPAKSLRSE